MGRKNIYMPRTTQKEYQMNPHSFQPGIVSVPGHDRNAQVASQLEKVLSRRRVPPVQLCVGQIQDGRHVLGEELLAQRVQNHWRRTKTGWNRTNQRDAFAHRLNIDAIDYATLQEWTDNWIVIRLNGQKIVEKRTCRCSFIYFCTYIIYKSV